MATNHTLDASIRTVIGKKVKHLRTAGQIPATVYGKGFPPVSVSVDDRAFNTIYRRSGKTALIDLTIDGTPAAVFVQEVQRHPLSRAIIHIDFKAVDLKVLIYVEVPVVAIGESPLVARGDALLNHVLNTVMVEALPADLPQHIEVDISILDSFDKQITAGDIPAAKGYKVLADPEQVLLSLAQLRAATEDEAAEAAPAEPELIRPDRKSDEEA